MNHIYKVIWNKAKNCYTVVSEIAKSHSTSSVTKKKVSIAAILVAGMLSGFSPMVSGAADTIVYDQNGTSLKSTNSNGVGKKAIALGQGASAVDNSIAIGNGAYTQDGTLTKGQSVALGNGAVTGAKSTSIGNNAIGGREGTITIGANAKNEALYSTVVGTDSKITSDGTAYTLDLGFLRKPVIVQGAVSTSFGAHNTITNTGKVYSGVANSIIGSVNTVTNSNGVTIQGTGNTVTGAYKDMNLSSSDWSKLFFGGDYSVLKEKESGAIAIIGGANTISNQTSSTVIGYGNTLEGKNSTGVFTAGSKNTLTNVSNSLVMGDNNTLKDRKNVISLGNNNTVTANKAVAIGNGTTVEAEGGVAIGTSSVAKGDHSIAIGNESNVDSDDGLAIGYKSKIIKGSVHEHGTSDATVVGNQSVIGTDSNLSTIIGANSDIDGQAYCSTIIGAKSSISWGASGSTAVGEGTKVYKAWGTALGSGSKVTKENGTALGTYSSVTVDDGVAIGAISRADRAAGELGYLADTDTTDITWKANKGAVSVGSSAAKFTRQITNVAAGTYDTDAVNVAQLKKVNSKADSATEMANKGWNLTTGASDATQVKPGDTVDFSGDKNISVSHKGTDVSIALKDTLTLGSNATDGYVTVDGVEGTVWAGHAVSAGNVNMDGDSGEITGLTNTTLNSKDFATTGRAATEEQLKLVKNQADSAATEASKHSKVVNGSNITVEETDQDGQKTYKVGLNKDLLLGDITGKNVSISGTNGTIETTGFIATKDKIYADKGAKLADVNVTGDTISNDKSSVKLDKEGTVTINNRVTIDQSGKISGVAAGEISSTSTDAVNGSQLHAVQQEAGKHTKVVNGSNITVEETDQDGQKTYKVGLNKDLLLGDITGKNVSISGTNGTIETTGFIATKDKIYADKGAKLADVNVTGDTISNDKSSVKLDKEGTVTINNRVTIDQSGKISGVAAGEISSTSTDAVNGSQLKATNDRVSQVEGNITEIKGDITNIKSDITNIKGDVKNLGDRVTKVEQEAGKHTKVVNGSNVTVEETDQDGQKTYKVGLNKDLLLGDITGKNVSISGTNGTIETTGSIATKDKIYADKGAKLADIDITGDTISNGQSSVKLDKEGTVTINGKVSVNQDGKVSGVAAGDISEKSTDAVNGSQLFATNQQVAQNVQSISKLGNRINKVGAGAAALAALHPLDFDPDDKWDFAAGYGNYNGENAAAIGAYYRPNEDTMFSVGGSFGNGENMVNAGVSLKLGQGNHVSTSKVAMAKEIKDLRKELEGLKSALLDVNAGKKLDTSKLQLFPDVPKNHWAYEYVSALKGNGMLTGYPDGEFKGDRPMTRYEFATMLYKAMLEGATLSDKILKEFAPELERFTVDTVHQDKDGKPTVERVRTVKAEK